MTRAIRLLSALLLSGISSANAESAPQHIAGGTVAAPKDYREWVFLSSGLNMNYAAKASVAGGDDFDNVFVDPVSWNIFKKTGKWPQGTIFAKEGRHGKSEGSINHSGQFQAGDSTYLELHIRDARLPTGWGFFEINRGKVATVLPISAKCYSCHQQHAAVETTFVQFYPTAKPIAIKAGTFDGRR